MKKLSLNNPSFRYLEKSFKEWLDILGYSPSTVYSMPTLVRELLHYLERQGIKSIKELDIKHIDRHYENLKERSNQRRDGGLSNGHLNKHIQALRRFTDYLRKVGRLQLPALKIGNEETGPRVTFLSEEEIKQLFAATYHTYGEPVRSSGPGSRPNIPEKVLEAIGARDRALLAVFYGCGLRRNEGVMLDVGDVNFDRAMLHVRKGKNYKERFVPVSKTSLKYLQDYIYDHRPELLKDGRSDALFISYNHCGRMRGQSLAVRLKRLMVQTGNAELIDKEAGLHTLRHSIATHLLAAGMPLESISRFLGHSSLESTQVYTHLPGMEQEAAWRTDRQDYPNIPKYEIGKLHEDE